MNLIRYTVRYMDAKKTLCILVAFTLYVLFTTVSYNSNVLKVNRLQVIDYVKETSCIDLQNHTNIIDKFFSPRKVSFVNFFYWSSTIILSHGKWRYSRGQNMLVQKVPIHSRFEPDIIMDNIKIYRNEVYIIGYNNINRYNLYNCNFGQ